jgi:signal transduction histidine kinase
MMANSKEASQEIQALTQKVNVYERLVQMSLNLNSTMGREELLRYLMQAAAEITNAEGASILLIHKDTNQLRFVASSGGEAETLLSEGVEVPLDGSIAGTVVKEDRPIMLNNTRTDTRHFRQLDEKFSFDTRSILGVPMRIRDSVAGVLEVVNKAEGKKWTQQDLDALLILAAQAAVAIEKADLITQLQEAYDEVSKLDKLKNDFIAIASHELRTPLGVILGYASFLKEESEGEAGSHALMVMNSALHLRSLIEDMTNLRYLQGDTADLMLEDVSLRTFFRDVTQDVREMAEAKSQTFDVVMPDASVLARLDTVQFATALNNVLNNAIKFTPEGGSIRLYHEMKGGEIWIRVEDTGVGVPEEHREKIFEPFYQVADHLTREHGGMGLGLAIARVLVDAHGGRIWMEPRKGESGSLFTISLPARAES